MLSKDYVFPEDGTTKKDLFDAMNRYDLNVFNSSIKGGQEIIILRKHENVMDGREVLICLIDFYEIKANLDLLRTQCQTELATMQLTWNYPGGALKLFQMFQSNYLGLDNPTHTVISEEDTIGQLNASLHDDRFQNVHTTCKTLAL